MAKRPTFKQFRKEALKNPKVKAEYEALSTAFEIKRQMINMRKKAGVTQEEIAHLLGTQKSSISRLESINTKTSPRLSTLEDYAHALGYRLTVGFERTN